MNETNVIKLNDPVMYLKMAVKSLNEDDFENAIKRCLRAVDLSFEYGYKGVDSSLLGLVYLKSGNYKEALTSFYRALAYGNKQSLLKVHLMIIQCFVSDKKVKFADDYIKFLLDVNLIDEETKDIIVENYNAILEDSRQERSNSYSCVSAIVKDAIASINSKDFETASRLLIKAKSICPNNIIVNYLYQNLDEAFSGNLTSLTKLPDRVIAEKMTSLENVCKDRSLMQKFIQNENFGANLHFAMEYGNLSFLNEFFDAIFDCGANNKTSYLLEDLLFSDYNDDAKLLLLRKFIERRYIQKHCIRCKNRLNIVYPIYFNGNEKLYFEPAINAVEQLTKNKKILNIDLLYVLNYLDANMTSENIKYLEDRELCEKLIIYKYFVDLNMRVPQAFITETLKEAVKAFKIEYKKEARKLKANSLPENVILFPTKKN